MALELSKLNCQYGAPMGRNYIHRTGLTGIEFLLERVPLVDGDYDCGGAYWGSGVPIWCVDYTTPLRGVQIVRYYVRAEDREKAMRVVLRDYPSAKFKPETGSIIRQTIAFLQNYLDQGDEEGRDEDTEADIALLQDELDNIERNLK